MREIKFRAWDRGSKRMLFPLEITFLNYGVKPSDGWVVARGENWKFDTTEDGNDEDIIIMQYTGLKDKNENEIYEGDIVKVTLSDDGDKQEWMEAQVFFENGAFKLVNESFSVSVDSVCEVIGNIYENPELLKDHELSGNKTEDL